MKYFKVKIGYGADDFISIDQTELRKAVIAQVKGGVVIFNEGSVAGNSIISVLPDYNREMGYHRDYKLTGEDYDHIGTTRVGESRLLIENAVAEAQGKKPLSLEGNEMTKQLADKFKI